MATTSAIQIEINISILQMFASVILIKIIMEKVKLNNGIEMPILGFGVFRIMDLKECEKSVLDAFEIGYRSIDTASSYLNEEAVGSAIVKSAIPRNELFITSKLWSSANTYEETIISFNKTLSKLQTDYLDLYLIHQPLGDIYGAWRAMEELYEQKKIRAIGVSNFHLDRVIDLMVHNKIKPAINQIETHPFYQQIETHKYLKAENIQIEAWAPLANGKNNLFTNNILTDLGKKYDKSVAQVTLRWLTQRGIVAIPKTTNKNRMIENYNIFDFELSEEDMSLIREIDTNKSSFFDHRDPDMIKWLGKINEIEE